MWRSMTLVVALCACTQDTHVERAAEPLYLAVQVSENGHTLASPKVLGFEGRSITSSTPDCRLIMRPREVGTGYRVQLDLELPSGKHLGGGVRLLHGEERIVSLDASTTLTVLLMRVDSAEFKALMGLRPQRPVSI